MPPGGQALPAPAPLPLLGGDNDGPKPAVRHFFPFLCGTTIAIVLLWVRSAQPLGLTRSQMRSPGERCASAWTPRWNGHGCAVIFDIQTCSLGHTRIAHSWFGHRFFSRSDGSQPAAHAELPSWASFIARWWEEQGDAEVGVPDVKPDSSGEPST